MPNDRLRILLDQNIPFEIKSWLQHQRPEWIVESTRELGFSTKPDSFLYQWAIEHKSIIITFDEDFADARLHALGQHHGVIRLRTWPTTVEKTKEALMHLLQQIPDNDLRGALVIIDNQKIRIRHPFA